MMKALVLTDYMKFEYLDVPLPEIGPDEVLIQVRAAGICGSDVYGMDGSTGRRIPPIIMGHEASGIIADVGEQVEDWKKGNRVTFDSTVYKPDDWYTRGGMYNLSDGREIFGVSTEEFKRDGAFAEFVAVPRHLLYEIPDNVSFVQAAMTEPAAVAFHAINMTPVSNQVSALVIGAGMIGSFIIQGLRMAGCSEIIAVDREDERLDMAKVMGATVVLNPGVQIVPDEVRKRTGRGVDVAFGAVGIPDTTRTAIDCLRKGGSLTLVGNLSSAVEIPLQRIVTDQLRVQGSSASAGEFPSVLEMMASGKINTDPLVSAEVPLPEGADWFRRLYEQEKGLLKVILIPGL